MENSLLSQKCFPDACLTCFTVVILQSTYLSKHLSFVFLLFSQQGETGRITLEGCLGEDYFAVRELLYDQYAIVWAQLNSISFGKRQCLLLSEPLPVGQFTRKKKWLHHVKLVLHVLQLTNACSWALKLRQEIQIFSAWWHFSCMIWLATCMASAF